MTQCRSIYNICILPALERKRKEDKHLWLSAMCSLRFYIKRSLWLIFIQASKNKVTDPASAVRLRKLLWG